MFTVISRIIHFGFTNFWRNGWLSVATVAVMVLSLLVFVGLIFFNVITNSAVSSVQDKIDISVYFKDATREDDILQIKQSLESLPQVASVRYISQDEALKIFQESTAVKNDDTISQALSVLDENPLEASLDIKAYKPDQYQDIAAFLDSPSLSNSIDKVSYKENQVVIDRLNTIINNVNRGGLVVTILMAIVAGLVVFNTVWIAIYSNRDEIGIMRAVGASNVLVRGPYMVEGVIAGVVAAILSLIVIAPFVHFVSPHLESSIPSLNLAEYFYTHLGNLLLYQLLFGAVVGSVSSFLAVRRYLRS